MTRIVVAAAFIALAAAASGCAAPHPYVNAGNRNSVEIGYGGDVESAQPLARQFCAQFDRTPRLTEAAANIAYFDCVPRH